jgi:hypothetical protein
MRVQNFTNYSKLYEAKLMECQFLTEQNITADDIITPLELLITEEFISNLIQKGKQAVSNVFTNVKDAISKFFTGVVEFFKNFSLKKLAGSIFNKIKEIGTKTWNKIKDMLSGFKEFIVSNGLADENNRPNFQKIWTVLCQKAKSAVNWQEAGVTPDKLQSVGNQVKLNESDSKSIGDDEVKYYGVFEKIAHALGIKNARFNGVVSQIMKKTTIGLIIIGILKVAGISLAGLTLGLSPVAMAAIGGMLLMAGLIILAIWVCKPYPTVDDCLAYLHMAFGGNLNQNGVTNIFITDIDITYIEGGGISDTGSSEAESSEAGDSNITSKDIEKAKPLKSLYPTMIKNLQALKSMIISFEGVGIEGEESSQKEDTIKRQNKEEVERTRRQKVRESVQSFLLFEKEFSKEFSKQSRKVQITGAEEHLVQAFKNIKKSLQVLKDEKDKGVGITDDFVGDILDKKMDVEAKKSIKALYEEVYEHLYGKYSKTMSDLGPLFKESIEVISDKNKRKVVAEKMARLSKRTMQFEGENMYASLGEFGADMRDFNTTLKEIMTSFKAESVAESKVFSFKNYNNK